MQQKPLPIIRHATRDEISEIADLIVASLEPFRPVVSGEVLDRYIEYSRNIEGRWDSGDVLVIESNGVIAGTVTYVDHLRQPGQELPEGWASLRTLVVHPDARGQDFGRRLVDHCIKAARTGGAATIGLHTAAFMERARHIYGSFGFSRCPEHDFFASPSLGLSPSEGDILIEAYRLDL